jgi:hypothetical protein
MASGSLFSTRDRAAVEYLRIVKADGLRYCLRPAALGYCPAIKRLGVIKPRRLRNNITRLRLE